MFHYVYRIDRPSTGQWYVGLRSCRCWPIEDTKYVGSGTYVKRIPPEELTKQVLAIVETREDAARLEAALVGQKQLDDPLCMNLQTGGLNAHSVSEETRSKLSKKLQGNTRTKGRKLTPEHRRKISEAMQGLKRSEETREKMSAAAKRHPRGCILQQSIRARGL